MGYVCKDCSLQLPVRSQDTRRAEKDESWHNPLQMQPQDTWHTWRPELQHPNGHSTHDSAAPRTDMQGLQTLQGKQAISIGLS